MLSRFSLLTLLLFSSVIAECQNGYEDSLRNILKEDLRDTVRINLNLGLAEKFSRTDTHKFFGYSLKAYELSVDNNYVNGIILSSDNLGFYYRRTAQYDSALFYYDVSLKHCNQTHTKLANILYSIGNVYKAKDDFSKAIESYLSSLKVAETSENNRDIAISQLGLGSIYAIQNNLSKALEYFLKTEESFKKINDLRGVYISANNIGSCYYKMGNYQKAKGYFVKSKRLAEENRDTNGLGNILGNLSSIYNQENKLDSALHYGLMALDIRKKSEIKEGIIISYHNLSEISIALRKFKTAEDYLDTALILCNEIQSINELKFNWNYRAMLDSAKGDYKSAFNSLQKYYSYRTQVEEKEVKSNIEELQTLYETEKKEAEIASLSQKSAIQTLEIQQKNQGILIGLILLLFISSAAYFIYRQRISKSQKSQIEIEQRFLRSQLNPHFIFNALMAIQSFMLKNEAKTAALYLTKFSKLMREILENSRQEFILVEDEVKMLTNYLDIHKLRMNNSFSYSIEIDPNIDSEIETIPPMFVQPFVENAIEHGVINTNGKGMIEVNFKKENDYIAIVVKDNGGGLTSGKEPTKKHQSLASTIIQERMNLFNKSLKKKIKMLLEEIKNERGEIQGTKVELKVPFSYI